MENLRSIRKKKGYTQEDVAMHLKVTRGSYAKYERGERKPDPDMLIKLSEFFNVSIDYLVGNTNIPMTLAEVRFEKEVDYLSDDELIEKYNFNLDGEPVTREQLKKALELIRALGKD